MLSDLQDSTSDQPMFLEVTMPLNKFPESMVSRELTFQRNDSHAGNGHYNRTIGEGCANRQQQNHGRSGYHHHYEGRPQLQQSSFFPELQLQHNNFVQNMAERSVRPNVNHYEGFDFGLGAGFDPNYINSTMSNQHLAIGSMSANVKINLDDETNQHLNSFYMLNNCQPLFEASRNNAAGLALPPLPPLPPLTPLTPMPQCEINSPFSLPTMARSCNNSWSSLSLFPSNNPAMPMPLWLLPENRNYNDMQQAAMPPQLLQPPPGFSFPSADKSGFCFDDKLPLSEMLYGSAAMQQQQHQQQHQQQQQQLLSQPPRAPFVVGPNVYSLDEYAPTIFNAQLLNAQMKAECNRDLVEVLQEINELVFGPADNGTRHEAPRTTTAGNVTHTSGTAPLWTHTDSMAVINNNEKPSTSSQILLGPAGNAKRQKIQTDVSAQSTSSAAAAEASVVANANHALGSEALWPQLLPGLENNENSSNSSKMLYSEVAAIGNKCNQKKKQKKKTLKIINVQNPNEFGNASPVGIKSQLAENPYGPPSTTQRNQFPNQPGQQSPPLQQPYYKWPPIQQNPKSKIVGHGRQTISVVDADGNVFWFSYYTPHNNNNNNETIQHRALYVPNLPQLFLYAHQIYNNCLAHAHSSNNTKHNTDSNIQIMSKRNVVVVDVNNCIGIFEGFHYYRSTAASVPNYYPAPPFNDDNPEWAQQNPFNQNKRQCFGNIRRPNEASNNYNQSGNVVGAGQNPSAMVTEEILPLQMWK